MKDQSSPSEFQVLKHYSVQMVACHFLMEKYKYFQRKFLWRNCSLIQFNDAHILKNVPNFSRKCIIC